MNRAMIMIATIMFSSILNANPLKGLDPYSCLPGEECTCFTKPVVAIIADGIREGEKCKIERDELREFLARKHDAKQELAWYQDTSTIIGSLVASFALGGLVAYTVSQ